MPEISRFYGIIITMYYNDHGPAHFHAKYGEHKAKIAIATGQVTEGSLPRRAIALIEAWRLQHLAELNSAWDGIMARRPVNRIAPLE